MEKHSFYGVAQYVNEVVSKTPNTSTKKLVNEEVQKTAFILNINKAYEFYCTNIENGDLSARDITFDLQVYKHNLSLFLTESNFDVLHQRVKDHGIQTDYLSLLRFSITRTRRYIPMFVYQFNKRESKTNFIIFLCH